MNGAPFSLDGKTIVITGASSGIGAQCAVDCSIGGAKVVLIGRNNERLQETLQRLNGNDHMICQFDLSNINKIGELIEGIVSSIGKVNGFIHAAGVELTKPLSLIKEEDFLYLMNINVLSGLEIAKYLSKNKFRGENTKFVFLASITSLIGRSGLITYSASKGALVSAIRSMAIELSSKRINVNCISPGTVLTPMMQNYLDTLSAEEREKRISGFPLGIGYPEDISHVCTFLLSDAARWITGQNFVVDGGYTAT